MDDDGAILTDRTGLLAPGAAPTARRALGRPLELSIIVPTFNERDSVAELSARLDAALSGIAWEVVFVDDDSPDGTLDVLAALARSDGRVRYIHRIGRRGLSSAVIEGVLSTNAPYVAVMDADLQHDEHALPAMLAQLRSDRADIAVGSRYVAGGGIETWDRGRVKASRLATRAAGLLARAQLSDPMSGFFMVTRPAFMSGVRQLSGQGFKILLDLLASTQAPLRVVEVPYTFRCRAHGESKLDSLVVWEYGVMLLDKAVGHLLPVRFLMFIAVGGLGVFVHMAVLAALHAQLSFLAAQGLAAVVAMTFNFFVNNTLTYRDRRLKGVRALTRGLFAFYAVCAVGAVANVGIANFLFQAENHALTAGNWFVSGAAGILVGAVWNYAASSVFTWRKG